MPVVPDAEFSRRMRRFRQATKPKRGSDEEFVARIVRRQAGHPDAPATPAFTAALVSIRYTPVAWSVLMRVLLRLPAPDEDK